MDFITPASCDANLTHKYFGTSEGVCRPAPDQKQESTKRRIRHIHSSALKYLIYGRMDKRICHRPVRSRYLNLYYR